ncbi:PREDICTED: uncharacterized protein LOC106302697 [Brassica oleracea var. oleracea]|uniref:uncharacterized protein LOC106302697 n=1 Tax=Brassica oleracea var. oleracea TaxID=109376 RepID=UPI0006A6AD3F|nr:PREDICTED: uncharacterized protein LOC106302697 [Brassica oleracea var. oleracea]
MSSSPSEKKSSDVEMGEANSALPTPAMHEATPAFVAGFLSFKERLSRRSAEKEGGRIQPEVQALLSSHATSTLAGGNKSPGDATPFAESAMVPVQVPEVSAQPSDSSTTQVPASKEVSAQPSGSSTTPVRAPKEEKATELMPPTLDRKEIVLGLPASSAAPLTKSRKRTGAATETVKKRRCTAGAEGKPSGPLSQHRAKFVSLIDGMLSDCGSEIERSTRGLAESREALKQAEAVVKSTEVACAAELSQLEVRVSDLERDLGKSASVLFKLKKEKKSKASEVRRLQREIQNREESRTVVSRDDFHARLTRMAVRRLPTGTSTRSSLSCSSSTPSRRVRKRPRGKAPWLKMVEMLRAGEETTKQPREAMAVRLRMKVRAVYKKYSKIENGGVALVSPTKSLLGSAAADSKKP